MRTLQERLSAADALLAPYAVPHRGILGRATPEPEDATRFPFQRDRDRIVHTRAFRRLKGKTQVFIPSEGDHFRTRLTHTMEVALISRDIARTLGLNEDLAECIALAHDLGHPPFGHAGEDALNTWMEKHGGHFEHNEQSYRIVTLLEEHSSHFSGLNLNREVLEGLLKHQTPHDRPGGGDTRGSLEAGIVNIADEVAYTGHDCEDGLRGEVFSLAELTEVPLAREAQEHTKERGTDLRGSLIHLLVTDLYEASDRSVIRFSDSMRWRIDALRAFLQEGLYEHPTIAKRNVKGKEVIVTLCDMYERKPNEKVVALQKKTGSSLPEAIKDYVAGMTDEYAEKQGA